MILQLPRLRVIAACGVAACACASALGAYFGADCGGGLAFIGCWLLFVSALSLHPGRAQWIAAAALSALFAAMRTLGASYDAIDSYGLILKNARTLVTASLAMGALFAVALCCILLALALLERVRLRAIARRGVQRKRAAAHADAQRARLPYQRLPWRPLVKFHRFSVDHSAHAAAPPCQFLAFSIISPRRRQNNLRPAFGEK